MERSRSWTVAEALITTHHRLPSFVRMAGANGSVRV